MCRNHCVGKVGTLNIPCGPGRTQYIQCINTVCSSQSCASNELFDYATRTCQACPAGTHVDAYRTHCVCDYGTTSNFKTGTCGPCPTGSIQTADRCYCGGATVLNRAANACQSCPQGAVRSGDDCRCIVAKEFWNEDAFACQPCPGTWVTKTRVERRRTYTIEVCQCPNPTDVFNDDTVSCAPCPANSVLVSGTYGNSCQCTIAGQKYDDDTNTCVDRRLLD